MYYTADKALSYNPIMIMTCGARGYGKTYDWKVRPCLRFLKTGERFVWVRRYDSELQMAIDGDGFLKDIRDDPRLKGHELKSDSKFVYIDGKIAGEFIALSGATKYKSRSFANTWVVIFDEFIIDNSTYKNVRYLSQKEPELLVDLLNTIFRMRPVLCVCLANAVTFNNPYFMYYDIRPFTSDFYFDRKRRILVEIREDAEYTAAVNQSDIATLTRGTAYGDYAMNNKFLLDTNAFVEKRTASAHFLCGVHVSQGDVGFWYDTNTGLVYTSFAVDRGRPYLMFTLEKDNHDVNFLFLSSALNTPLATVIEAWKFGLLRFDDTRVKARAFGVLAYFIRR